MIERINGVKFLSGTPALVQTEELRCAHALFSMLKRHRFVVRKIGGVQFSNHHGEKIVQLALRVFLTEAVEYRVSQDVQDRALRGVKLSQDFGEFMDALGPDIDQSAIPLAVGTRAVLVWIRDPHEPLSRMVPVLTILREVILYEVDLPMELWYREAREFPSAVLSTAAGQLSGLKTRGAGDEVSRVEGIERKLQAYLKELETRLRAYIKDHTGPRRG